MLIFESHFELLTHQDHLKIEFCHLNYKLSSCSKALLPQALAPQYIGTRGIMDRMLASTWDGPIDNYQLSVISPACVTRDVSNARSFPTNLITALGELWPTANAYPLRIYDRLVT